MDCLVECIIFIIGDYYLFIVEVFGFFYYVFYVFVFECFNVFDWWFLGFKVVKACGNGYYGCIDLCVFICGDGEVVIFLFV